jgi:hypothetical protein
LKKRSKKLLFAAGLFSGGATAPSKKTVLLLFSKEPCLLSD